MGSNNSILRTCLTDADTMSQTKSSIQDIPKADKVMVMYFF